MDNTEHKRRVRYGGTHPKKFNEKYKELAPDKYAGDVAAIMDKGRTPAGMHISICVNEIMQVLDIQPNDTILDVTLGYGGHCSHMLSRLKGGHAYAIDADPVELAKTKQRLQDMGYGEDILTIQQMNFADIDKVSEHKYNAILADLGLSSMQIDNPERGFTFKQEGPLDLRLNQTSGLSAAQKLRDYNPTSLEKLLRENSDEPYARELAEAIIAKTRRIPIKTTRQLYDTIAETMSFVKKSEQKEVIKKTCQRVFQALRIDVNKEFEVLHQFLHKLPQVMASGGRVAVLTFHSGEDRLVKHYFKQYLADGIFSDISHDVIRPSAEECYRNPRATSAKLRYGVMR